MGCVIQLCFVTIMLVLLQKGYSMRCYQCHSGVKGPCDSPINTDKVKIQTCESHQNSCAHLSVTVDGNTEIRRECADINYCNQNSRTTREATSFSRSCSTCSGDLCNSGVVHVSSVPVGIAGFIVSRYVS